MQMVDIFLLSFLLATYQPFALSLYFLIFPKMLFSKIKIFSKFDPT